ncbi:hypothetical protein P175DRAFT_04428 [Aspergillus ochraceoroseus IBT 24754]|nr:uncharacterized protein P175DRAFT_04428 [Aspergillus ochraceoroseus IBT 24754]PTU23745.1 hypothetical protein P175DRAFT_04428 [Aspergillus ochraceoroseus IBT 24754]
MNSAGSSTAGRGLLSAYHERDNDDAGLLRPITGETTRSRWGSEPTAIGAGSRRGSLFDLVEEDKQLGLIKRPEDIRSMDDLVQVRNQRTKGEEYLRSALSLIGTLATDITRRLDYTYYGLLEKIAALNVTISSFQELSDSTTKLFHDFQHETTSLEQDIRKQVTDLKEFQPQTERIEALEERMRAGKARAGALSSRLEAMRDEIEQWEKRELESQKRINQSLRVFWGVIAAGILAIVIAAVIQNRPVEEPSSPTLPLKAVRSANHLPWAQKDAAGTSHIEHVQSPALSDIDTRQGPTEYDRLRIFDEL